MKYSTPLVEPSQKKTRTPKLTPRLIQKALKIAPNHAAALFNLAVLRAEFQSRPADALPLFERYLDVSASDDPERKTAQRYVSDLKAQAKSASEAPSASAKESSK